MPSAVSTVLVQREHRLPTGSVALLLLVAATACRFSRDEPEAARPAYTLEELRTRLIVDRPRLSLTGTRKDGLEFVELSCALPPEEIEGVTDSIDALAKRKPVLDLCWPSGTVAVLTWIGSPDGPTDLRAFSTLGPDVDTCIESALVDAVTPTSGRCAAAVLLGNAEGADAAKQAFRAVPEGS